MNNKPIMEPQMEKFFEEHIPEFFRYLGTLLDGQQQQAALNFSSKLVNHINGLERGVAMASLTMLAYSLYMEWRDERIAARAAEAPQSKFIN